MAGEINADAVPKGYEYNFGDVGSRSDIGPQRLTTTGWGPGSVVPDMIRDEKTLPKQCGDGP